MLLLMRAHVPPGKLVVFPYGRVRSHDGMSGPTSQSLDRGENIVQCLKVVCLSFPILIMTHHDHSIRPKKCSFPSVSTQKTFA